MAVRAISLFAGVGGLDLGVNIALPGTRTVLYVEREAYAAAVLAARMASGDLDEAPIYSDIAELDCRGWRDKVDLVHGGIPCQPYSLAGERKGNEDERALWPEFARVVAECRPSLVFIENVPAFVVRGGFRPLGEELCRLGYEIADPFFIGAGTVGAPHLRERVFVLAYSERAERWPIVRSQLDRQGAGGRKTTGGACDAGSPLASERGGMADAEEPGRWEREQGRGPEGRAAARGSGAELADAQVDHRARGKRGKEAGTRAEGERRRRPPVSSGELADSGEPRFRITRCSRKSGKRFLTPLGNDAHGCNQKVADASIDGSQGWIYRVAAGKETDWTRDGGGDGGAGEVGGESVPDTERDSVRECSERGGDRAREAVTWHAQPFPVGKYPPGPKDFDEWERALSVAPWLAPAVEPGVRLLVNGVAMVVDENRAHQLRCVGNGVVPDSAAVAIRTLLEWEGLA